MQQPKSLHTEYFYTAAAAAAAVTHTGFERAAFTEGFPLKPHSYAEKGRTNRVL